MITDRGNIGCLVNDMYNIGRYNTSNLGDWLYNFCSQYYRHPTKGAFVVFSDRTAYETTYDNSPQKGHGEAIVDYIRANGLGEIWSRTEHNPNYPAQPDHMGTLWVWIIDQKKLKEAWIDIQKEKEIEKEKAKEALLMSHVIVGDL